LTKEKGMFCCFDREPVTFMSTLAVVSNTEVVYKKIKRAGQCYSCCVLFFM